ncbi:MAG TPA: lamin tail domain-containing protein, partial [Pyrinomonadaceae bacterium]
GSAGRAFSPGTRVDGSPFLPSPAISLIEVSPANASILVGTRRQLTARAFDSSGGELSGIIFGWQSKNPSAAPVDSQGLVTALAEGMTEVTASARGVQSAPALVTARLPERILTRIEVAPASSSVNAGGTRQFAARALDQNDQEMKGVTFEWSSSNTGVAIVDQNGLAKTLRTGAAIITASVKEVSGPATLTVNAPPLVINEILADPPDGIAGDANHDGVRSGTDDEFIELVNSSNAPLDISGWSIRTRTLTGTTETARHTFAAGTKVPIGDALVIFGGGSFDAENPLFGGAQVVRTSTSGLSLTNSGLHIVIRDQSGDFVSELAYGTPDDNFGGDSVNQSITRSPDTTGDFVRHTQAGGAGGRLFSPGTKADGSFFAPRALRLARLLLSPASATVFIGQTVELIAQAQDQFGRPLPVDNLIFSSVDESVALVEKVEVDTDAGRASAMVRGLSKGSVQITASAEASNARATSEPVMVSVIPEPPRLTRVEVSPALSSINRGATLQFSAVAYDQNGQPISGLKFNWASGDSSLLTVDSNGLARGAGAGAVSVTANASDGTGITKSGQASVTVRVPVIINEILADPPDGAAGDANRDGTRSGTQDEFIEIINESDAPVDISSVFISDSTGKRFTFPANTTLAPGRAALVFGGGALTPAEPAFGGALVFAAPSGLGLDNNGDSVTLKLTVSGSEVLIDSLAYGPEGGDNQSLTRSPDLNGLFTKHAPAQNSD